MVALAAPVLAARLAAAMPLHPTGDLRVDGSLLGRCKQRLGLGDRPADILRAFRHLLEGGDFHGRTGAAVVLGDFSRTFMRMVPPPLRTAGKWAFHNVRSGKPEAVPAC